MSSARRAYDILRGYVNNGWERFQGAEETDAERELREALEQPNRVAAESRDVDSVPHKVTSMSVDRARRLIGVPPEATTKQIRVACQDLRKIADPNLHRDKPENESRARQALFAIDAAERVLIENVDPTVRRFENLQIE